MNERETERRLRDWLDAQASPAVPDALRGAVAAIPATEPAALSDRLAAALGLRPATVSRPAVLLLVGAGLLAALVGGMLIVGSQMERRLPAVVPPLPTTATPLVTTAPTPTADTPSAAPTAATPSAAPTSTPAASVVATAVAAASLPVRADALAAGVALEPTTGSRLFVAVGTSKGTVLALLDARGNVARGWPLLVRGASGCGLDVDAADGSVRAVCTVGESVRAYALDRSGRLMKGWPVDLPAGGPPTWRSDPARVVDGDLYVVLRESTPEQAATLVRVGRDGSLRTGVSIRDDELVGCCAAIGPDGTAYLVNYVGGGTPGVAYQTMLSGLTLDGLRPGYPLKIDGSASVPAFGPDGRVYVAVDKADYTVATGSDSSSQVMAFTPDGRVVAGWPVELPIDTGYGDSEGIGAPLPPLVAPDGSVSVVSGRLGGTVAYALDPTGEVRAGWPFKSGSRVVAGATGVGGCPSGCGMCGLPFSASPPRSGPDGSVYVAQATRGDAYDGGNRIVAVDAAGSVRAGWPVTLVEKGSWFATFRVGEDGSVFGYAIEPAGTERNQDYGICSVFSGTVVALDAHGDPIYTTTLVVP